MRLIFSAWLLLSVLVCDSARVPKLNRATRSLNGNQEKKDVYTKRQTNRKAIANRSTAGKALRPRASPILPKCGTFPQNTLFTVMTDDTSQTSTPFLNLFFQPANSQPGQGTYLSASGSGSTGPQQFKFDSNCNIVGTSPQSTSPAYLAITDYSPDNGSYINFDSSSPDKLVCQANPAVTGTTSPLILTCTGNNGAYTKFRYSTSYGSTTLPDLLTIYNPADTGTQDVAVTLTLVPVV